jgi:hypothetical protein
VAAECAKEFNDTIAKNVELGEVFLQKKLDLKSTALPVAKTQEPEVPKDYEETSLAEELYPILRVI